MARRACDWGDPERVIRPTAMNIRLFLEGLRPPRPSHRVGGWGNLVPPSPCARATPAPSRGRGRGDTRFPHPPARTAIRCNEGDGPLPSPPPLGEGVRLLPSAGGGWEGGCGAACANVNIRPRRGEWGNRVSPSPGSSGNPLQRRCRPPPQPSPAGGGSPAPPPSGGRVGAFTYRVFARPLSDAVAERQHARSVCQDFLARVRG